MRYAITALTMVGLLLVGSMASADDLSKMREQVEVYTLKLADLEKADKEQAALKDIKLTERWLSEAQAQIAKEEEDVAKRYLRRVEISLEMIALIIDSSKSEKVAYERESAAIAMEKEANEAQVLLTQTETKEKKLNQEIGELRKTLDAGKKGGSQ